MNLTPKFIAKNYKTTIDIIDRDILKRHLLNMPDEVEVKIIPHKSTRSDKQNKYYWKVIIHILSEELGYTPDEIHEILKYKFLKDWITLPTKKGDEEICIIKSTTSLNTAEAEDYFSNIRTWASIDLGVYIPLPNEIMEA